jgi:Holliday junction resolvase
MGGGRMSRNKGKRGEREVSSMLSEAGWKARRAQQFCGSPDGGASDVLVESAMWPFHVEVKYCQQTKIYDWMQQSANDSKTGKTPIVCHRRNQTGWHVTMKFQDWINLVNSALPISNNLPENPNKP